MSKDETPSNSIAIVGMSCLFPKADGLEQFWHNIRSGADAIQKLPGTHWSASDYFDNDPKTPDMTYAQRGGFLPEIDFNPLDFGIPPTALEATDTSQLLGMVAAQRALRDAGYQRDGEFDRDKVSVILGVTGCLELVIPLGARLGHPLWRRSLLEAGVDEATAEDVVARISDGYVDWQENSFPGLLGNVVAGRIANRLDLGGSNCVVDAACASSLAAMRMGILELESGRADMVVTGGVDTFNDIFMYMCFSKTPALSPSGNARPFDHQGDGTILGEGIGMLVLKRLQQAEEDGDRIYAVVRSVGSSSDGRGNAIYAPSSSGQAVALRRAYEEAQVSPETVELVEAHGTGTKVGDGVEARALTDVYREANSHGTWCALGSVKSQIGHTKAAAGVAGVIKAVLALHNRVLPPTLKVERPLDDVAPRTTPFYINTESRPWLARTEHPRRAAVSSFGFGGSNFHCVLEEHPTTPMSVGWTGEVQILAFSADSKEQLLATLEVDHDSWNQLREASVRLRERFDSSHPYRLLMVVEQNESDVTSMLSRARELLTSTDSNDWATPDGIFFGSGEPDGRLAMLFPGQGSQYSGMLRDLACMFPELRTTLEHADQAYWDGEEARARGQRLSDAVYPHSTFDATEAERVEEQLRATETAQPAIGAVSLGALRVLERFGVRPHLVAGHSYGELTALCAAERIGEESFHTLSNFRGRLMARQTGDRGSMLAVFAELAQVEGWIRQHGLELVVANRNAPKQMVLSGATTEIERALKLLESEPFSGRRLPVSAAFHSTLVANAREPFEEVLERMRFSEGALPVFANSTAEPYPEDADAARKLLANQLASPVEFVREIENLYGHGARTFVEVGPGTRLRGLVEAILGDRECAALSIDGSSGKRSGLLDLALTLARVAARGHATRLSAWDSEYVAPPQPRAGLSFKLSGANIRTTEREARPNRPAAQAVATPMAPPQAIPQPTAVQPASADITTVTPQAQPTPVAPSPSHPQSKDLEAAFRATQEHLDALRSTQEQTARLHEQFLASQQAAQETLQLLFEERRRVLTQGSPLPVAAYVPAPAPPPATVEAPSVPTAAVEQPDVPAQPSPEKTTQPTVTASAEDNADTLLAVVAEKTGYPQEMLELSMHLDSDLGIDSIKRVEILSALQERIPDTAPVTPDELGSIETLADVLAKISVAAPVGNAVLETHTDQAPAPSDHGGTLLEVVAEKTGYPQEMLELTMHLDSDLGIDSIKRVEILSALQERIPEAPTVSPDELGSIETLADVLAKISVGSVASTTQEAPSSSEDLAGVSTLLLDVVAEKTGYPVEMLELSMALDSDLGIDSIKRVEILSALQERHPGLPAVRPEDLGSIETLSDIVQTLGHESPGTADQLPTPANLPEKEVVETGAELERFVVQLAPLGDDSREPLGLVAGSTIWISIDGGGLAEAMAEQFRARGFKPRLITTSNARHLKQPERLGGLIVLAPQSGSELETLRDAVQLARVAAPALEAEASTAAALFATISRIDGCFGMANEDPSDPNSGGLAGLSKSASHEWPDVTCRALDLGAQQPATMAATLVDELLLTGPVEVGVTDTGKQQLQLVSAPIAETETLPLEENDVLLVTGGARGVTAESLLAVAEERPATIVILGRTAIEDNDPEWLRGVTEASAVKRAILDNAAERLTPKQVDLQYRSIEASREVRANLKRLSATGSRVIYEAVDIRDREQIQALLQRLNAEFGPVRGLVHGAGVLADQLIVDKDDESFDRVFATKVRGLENLLESIDEAQLRFVALFSSTTARFGRTGQSDYAMANEVLNKTARRIAKRLPDTRVVSVNWGPWEGGMVTPELRPLFEREGVGLIPLGAGSRQLVRELKSPRRDVEAVILGSGSRLPVAVASEDAPVTRVLPLVFERTMSIDTWPFLRSHVMDGRAVLPMALMVEWLAHGALHGNPGLRFHGFDGLRVFKGVTLESQEQQQLRVHADRGTVEADLVRVPVELRSTDDQGRDRLHASAEIILAEQLPADGASLTAPTGSYSRAVEDAYRELLFHGPDLQGIEEIENASEMGISARSRTAPAPAQWSTNPLRNRWIADPLMLDVAFQLMILWSCEQLNARSLPCFAGSYRQFRRSFPSNGARVVIAIKGQSEHNAYADIEFLDDAGLIIARLENYECVVDASLEGAFKNNRLPQVDPAR